tara:strand:- start:163 stop:360 length:198 start_codon:yes stop_codon:yes gene_type:complete
MNNKILQQKINRRKSLIADLPFDSEGVTFDNPSMTVEQGMARANRLALKGVESNNLNLYRLRGGK